MAVTKLLTIVKRFTYRGNNEEWSNSYALEGTVPANAGQWKTLADAVILSEAGCYQPAVNVVRAYGNLPGVVNSVAQIDYVALGGALPAGTLTVSGVTNLAGDQAAWVRALIGLSATGKKVYVRKYFHGGISNTGNPDQISPTWQTKMTTHANKMLDGTLPDASKWVGPGGETPSQVFVGPFITTRTLKRRGKRP